VERSRGEFLPAASTIDNAVFDKSAARESAKIFQMFDP
jgi:hypothetical protein